MYQEHRGKGKVWTINDYKGMRATSDNYMDDDVISYSKLYDTPPVKYYESRRAHKYNNTAKRYADINVTPRSTGSGMSEDGISVYSNDNVTLHLPGYSSTSRNQSRKGSLSEKQFRHVGVQMTTNYVVDQPPKKEVLDASTQTRPITPPSPVVIRPSTPPQPRVLTPPPPIIEILEEETRPIVLPTIPKRNPMPLLFYAGVSGKTDKGRKAKNKQIVYPIRIIQVDRKQVHDRYLAITKLNAQNKTTKKPLHVTFRNIYKERPKHGLDNSF